jgi:hypothetical protein
VKTVPVSLAGLHGRERRIGAFGVLSLFAFSSTVAVSWVFLVPFPPHGGEGVGGAQTLTGPGGKVFFREASGASDYPKEKAMGLTCLQKRYPSGSQQRASSMEVAPNNWNQSCQGT